MKKQLSVYHSENMDLRAIVYHDVVEDTFEVNYAKNGLSVATESYAGHSSYYHESAAENYCAGIKIITDL